MWPLLLALLAMASSCASYRARVDSRRHGLYCGVDLAIERAEYWDVPASAVVDSLLIPYDVWMRRVAPLPRVAFQHREHRLQNELSADEIRTLQFFLSERLTLYRQVPHEERTVTSDSHRLSIRHGEEIEEIIFETGTPGVVVGVGRDYLDVCFEASSTATLRFQTRDSREYVHREQMVEYGGKRYSAEPIDTVYLMVRETTIEVLKHRERRVVPGVER